MFSAFHNYEPFNIDLLIFPGIVLYISLFTLGYLGSKSVFIAWFIATIKTSIFILYFGCFFDGTYTSVDDEHYLATGKEIYLLFTDRTMDVSINDIRMIVGGSHIIYNVINAISMVFFGNFYFSPVVINIIVSAFAGVICVKLIKQQQMLHGKSLNYFFLFFVLHPEMLSWSTVFNGKDTLVLFMHIMLLYAISLFISQKKISALFFACISIIILVGLRFYVPFILGGVFLLYMLVTIKISLKKLISLGFVASLFLFFVVPWGALSYSFELFKFSFINPLSGALHFLLTPRPFFYDEIHGFLNLASIINWLLFPIFLMGIYIGLKSKHKFIFFLFLYLFTFVFFYGSFDFLNGPRHRLQLLLAISIFQFIGLKWLIWLLLPHKLIKSPDKARTKIIDKFG
jgi:hypothetical protein